VGADGDVCTSDYFYKTWQEVFPTLKLKPGGDFMKCQTCTLLEQKMYGPTSGGRGGGDKAEMEKWRAEHDEHMNVSSTHGVVSARDRVVLPSHFN